MSDNSPNAKLPCAAARDLIPLYADNLTSEETNELMREHIAGCPACAQSLGISQSKLEFQKNGGDPDFQAKRALKRLWRKRLLAILAALTALVLLLSLFSNLRTRLLYADNLEIAGRYQLPDGRIVIALRAPGLNAGNARLQTSYSIDGEYDSGRLRSLVWHGATSPDFMTQVEDSEKVEFQTADEPKKLRLTELVSVNVAYTLWDKLFKGDAGLGDVMYLVVDPQNAAAAANYKCNDAEAALLQREDAEVALEILWNGFGKIIYHSERDASALRQVTDEEAAVLLKAVQAYQKPHGAADSITMEEGPDALDALMAK